MLLPPRCCLDTIPRNLAVGATVGEIPPVFAVLFRRAPHQTVQNLLKVSVLPLGQLLIVSWRHIPRETWFSSLTRFVCPPGVSTTPGFQFHTHLTVGDISAPQRADIFVDDEFSRLYLRCTASIVLINWGTP